MGETDTRWLRLGRALVIVGALAIVALLLAGPQHVAQAWLVPVDSALRHATIALALLIFLSGWNHQGRTSIGDMVFAFGFLAVGLMDFAHVLSSSRMPDFITPNTPQKEILLCVLTRATAAGVILARLWLPERAFDRTRRARWLAVTLIVTALAIAAALTGADAIPPLAIDHGVRSLTGILVEATISLALVAALVTVLLRDAPQHGTDTLLTIGVAALMVGEGLFLVREHGADVAHLAGFAYKVLAGAAFYRLSYLRNLRMPYLREQSLRRRLAEKERFLDTLITEAPDGVLVIDEQGAIVAANNQLLLDFGYAAEELIGRPVEILLPPSARERHVIERSAYARAPYSRPMGHMRAVHGVRSDGTPVPVEISLGGAELDGRRCAVAFVRNIETRRRLEDERSHLLGVLEESPDWVFQADAGLLLSYANPAARQAFALAQQGAGDGAGVPLEQLFDDVDLPLPPEAMFAAARRAGVFSGETHLRCGHGRRIPVSIVVVAHREDDGTVARYSLIARDLSERVNWEQQLEHSATHDSLTGLPNRLVLIDRIEQAIEAAERNHGAAALMFLDLDNFKLINDTLGHKAGDTVLVTVAQRLQACLRSGDTLARFGGDEFVIIAPGLRGEEDATGIARKLLDALDAPIPIGDSHVAANASIGICMIPRDADSADVAMSHADQAMYRSKRAGRGHYKLYAAEFDCGSIEDVELASALKDAIRADNGELELHYQPVIDLGARRIVCVEALLRWNSERFGPVGPDRFVPLAEETGMILELGHWMLSHACRQLAAWRGAGLDIRLAVNVSVHELKQPEFAATLETLMSGHGLPFDAIELEVTETALVRSIESTAGNLERLRQLGVRIVLDDFGTGYSSLAHLQSMPVDKIKIDRGFVHAVSVTRNNRYIVDALIRLAGQLGLDVIAEGVETAADLEVLEQLGCLYVQGWLFHRALATRRCTELLEEERSAA